MLHNTYTRFRLQQYEWSRQPLNNVTNVGKVESKRTERSTLSRLLDQRSRQANDTLADIDSVDKDDPQAVAQYACDIYNYYKEVEGIYHPQDYMSSQVSF